MQHLVRCGLAVEQLWILRADDGTGGWPHGDQAARGSIIWTMGRPITGGKEIWGCRSSHRLELWCQSFSLLSNVAFIVMHGWKLIVLWGVADPPFCVYQTAGNTVEG